jgi:hypothetical protein
LKYAAVFYYVVWLFFYESNRGLPVVGNDLIITITLELANGDLKVINSNGRKGY